MAFEALSSPLQNKLPNPILLFKATADPDTMYFYQYMKEPDVQQLKKAMQEEIDAHNNYNN